jgi:hypothetical protein
VLTRASKTVTHLVFGAGGDGNAVVGCLDEGAFLVGPSWVEACEAGRCEAAVTGHEWREEEALEAAGDGEEKPEEKKKQDEEGDEEFKPEPAAEGKSKQTRKRREADVPRDETGSVIVPFTVAGVTVTSLGTRVAHCSPTALYSIGYAAEAMRPSYKHPSVKVCISFFFSFFFLSYLAQVRYQYTVEEGPEGGVLFRLLCPHDPGNSLTGTSPDAVCSAAAALLAEQAGKKTNSAKCKGEEWFGLSLPAVRQVLQVCLKNVWRKSNAHFFHTGAAGCGRVRGIHSSGRRRALAAQARQEKDRSKEEKKSAGGSGSGGAG